MGGTLECAIVDVFAERAFAGNRLAVVRGAAGLDAAAMQEIARGLDYSETVFVTREDDGAARMRIFTPTAELPFAGHPVLGAAWTLARGADAFALDLPAGRVGVTFDAHGIAWMTPPPAALGEAVEPATAAALLGLGLADLDPALPCRRAVLGPRFVLVGLKGLDALRRAAVDPAVYAGLAAGGFLGVFACAAEGYSADADFSARMFFDAGGIREDPATGSANAAFAACLRTLGRRAPAIVEQGFEIGRPSRLYLEPGEPVRVGGRVRPVFDGTLTIEGVGSAAGG